MLEGFAVLAVIVVAWMMIYYVPRMLRVGVRTSHYRGRRGRPKRTSFGRRRSSHDADDSDDD